MQKLTVGLCVFSIIVMGSCRAPTVRLTPEEQREVKEAVAGNVKEAAGKSADDGAPYTANGELKTRPAPAPFSGKITEVKKELAIARIDLGKAEGVELGHLFNLESTEARKVVAQGVVRWLFDHEALLTVEPATAAELLRVGDLAKSPQTAVSVESPKITAIPSAPEAPPPPKEVISGRILTIDPPHVTVAIFGPYKPKAGDVLNVHRGATAVGRVELVQPEGVHWRAKIVYEIPNYHVSAGDMVKGFSLKAAPDK